MSILGLFSKLLQRELITRGFTCAIFCTPLDASRGCKGLRKGHRSSQISSHIHSNTFPLPYELKQIILRSLEIPMPVPTSRYTYTFVLFCISREETDIWWELRKS